MRCWLALIALASCGSPGHDVPDAAAPDGAADAASCAPTTGTLHDQALALGDGIETRYYWLHVPASYRCDAPAPLLVDFHGTASGAAPEEAYQTDALIAFSEAHGVIVARPRSRSSLEGGEQIFRWDQNAGDLERNRVFGKALVTALEMRFAIDPARVYASGFSSGSNMTAQFLIDPASPFKGLAPIAGGRWTSDPLPALADGPRIYMATGYRDYLWTTARDLIDQVTAAGLPADRLLVRRSGGGHDLYAWHFEELWSWLDEHHGPDAGAIAAPWTSVTLPQPGDVLALVQDGSDLVAAGQHGRLWRHAADWAVELDHGTADYTALCFGASTALVGGDYAAARRTAGQWSADGAVPDYGQLGAGWVNGASCRDDGSIAIVGYWSAALATGSTWSQLGAIASYGTAAEMAGIASAPGAATVIVGYWDYIGRAPHGSATAAPIAHPVQTEWWNAVTAAGGQFWVVGDGGAILTSADDGQSWTAQTSGTTENLYAVSFADATHGAAVGRRGTILVTSDGGAHWTARPLGRDAFLGAVLVDATTITIAGEGGLLASSPR
jgi:poly(3-hydroxybutyrate) depolymerase